MMIAVFNRGCRLLGGSAADVIPVGGWGVTGLRCVASDFMGGGTARGGQLQKFVYSSGSTSRSSRSP